MNDSNCPIANFLLEQNLGKYSLLLREATYLQMLANYIGSIHNRSNIYNQFEKNIQKGTNIVANSLYKALNELNELKSTMHISILKRKKNTLAPGENLYIVWQELAELDKVVAKKLMEYYSPVHHFLAQYMPLQPHSFPPVTHFRLPQLTSNFELAHLIAEEYRINLIDLFSKYLTSTDFARNATFKLTWEYSVADNIVPLPGNLAILRMHYLTAISPSSLPNIAHEEAHYFLEKMSVSDLLKLFPDYDQAISAIGYEINSLLGPNDPGYLSPKLISVFRLLLFEIMADILAIIASGGAYLLSFLNHAVTVPLYNRPSLNIDSFLDIRLRLIYKVLRMIHQYYPHGSKNAMWFLGVLADDANAEIESFINFRFRYKSPSDKYFLSPMSPLNDWPQRGTIAKNDINLAIQPVLFDFVEKSVNNLWDGILNAPMWDVVSNLTHQKYVIDATKVIRKFERTGVAEFKYNKNQKLISQNISLLQSVDALMYDGSDDTRRVSKFGSASIFTSFPMLPETFKNKIPMSTIKGGEQSIWFGQSFDFYGINFAPIKGDSSTPTNPMEVAIEFIENRYEYSRKSKKRTIKDYSFLSIGSYQVFTIILQSSLRDPVSAGFFSNLIIKSGYTVLPTLFTCQPIYYIEPPDNRYASGEKFFSNLKTMISVCIKINYCDSDPELDSWRKASYRINEIIKENFTKEDGFDYLICKTSAWPDFIVFIKGPISPVQIDKIYESLGNIIEESLTSVSILPKRCPSDEPYCSHSIDDFVEKIDEKNINSQTRIFLSIKSSDIKSDINKWSADKGSYLLTGIFNYSRSFHFEFPFIKESNISEELCCFYWNKVFDQISGYCKESNAKIVYNAIGLKSN